MSDFEYESEISASEHEAVYTHFKSINNEDTSVELTCTIEDSTSTQHSVKVSTGSKFKPCVLKCCETFVLLVLIFIIWSALSIPSVFFILSMVGFTIYVACMYSDLIVTVFCRKMD